MLSELDQRFDSVQLRLRFASSVHLYKKPRSLSGQMSLWTDEDEEKHPRNELGEFAKMEEKPVNLPIPESVKPIEVAETKPEVKERKMKEAREQLIAKLNACSRLTASKELLGVLDGDCPSHMDDVYTLEYLRSPSPIPDILEEMVDGGFVVSSVGQSDMRWPSQARKMADAIKEWEAKNPNASDVKFRSSHSGAYVSIVDAKIGSHISATIGDMSVDGISAAVKKLRVSHKVAKKSYRDRVANQRSVDSE